MCVRALETRSELMSFTNCKQTFIPQWFNQKGNNSVPFDDGRLESMKGLRAAENVPDRRVRPLQVQTFLRTRPRLPLAVSRPSSPLTAEVGTDDLHMTT